MHWLDWTIVAAAILIVIIIGMRTQRYMRGVADHYVRTFGIDGYRIDACSGSKIMNWNPAIPYARASMARSQGGLAMQRAIREGVRKLQTEGSTLAEVGGGLFGVAGDLLGVFFDDFAESGELPFAEAAFLLILCSQ